MTTLVGIIPGGRRAEDVFSDSARTTNYSDTYLISTTSSESQADVLTTTGLPDLFDGHPDDASVVVIRRRAVDVNEARTQWLVEVEYGQQPSRDSTQNPSDDPTDLSADVSWTYETIQQVLTKDVTGKAVATTAGEPFTNPPLTYPVTISVLTWSRWRFTFGGGAEQQAWMNKCNSAPWQGAQEYHVRIAGISADLEYIRGVPLWRVTDVLKFKPDGWEVIVPNKGTYYKDASGNKVSVATTQGQPIVALINQAGTGTTNFPYPQTFRPYSVADFAARYGS